MKNQKRTAMTTDDLMRQQEEHPRKRAKLTHSADRLSDGASGTSEDTDPSEEVVSERNVYGSTSSAGEESWEEGTGMEGPDHAGFDEDLPGDDSFAVSSRLKIKSRAPLKKSEANTQHPLKSFSSLGVSQTLEAALSAMSIRMPTEVQMACIPPLLAGESFLSSSKYHSIMFFGSRRQGLHRKCQDWLGKNHCVCTAYTAEAFC